MFNNYSLPRSFDVVTRVLRVQVGVLTDATYRGKV